MSNKGDAHMNLLFTLSSVLMIGAEITVASVAFAQGLPPAVAQKVQAAQKQVKTIGMEEYRKVVENPGGTLIVDVREPNEFAAGHVPGAINIPRGVIEFKIWNQVGYPANTQLDQPIVLQCQSGNRASLAAQSLADLGFTRITAVVMSLDDWQTTGQPFVK
jgi:rhodanese-related sulfurtransferase